MFRKLHTKEFNGGPDLRRADYKARNFLAISFGSDPISSDLLSLSHHELELVSSKKGIKGFPPYEEDPFFAIKNRFRIFNWMNKQSLLSVMEFTKHQSEPNLFNRVIYNSPWFTEPKDLLQLNDTLRKINKTLKCLSPVWNKFSFRCNHLKLDPWYVDTMSIENRQQTS